MFQEKLKNNFMAGLILLTPLILTILIINTFLGWTSFLVNPIIEFTRLGQYTDNNIFAAKMVVLVFGAIFVFGIGTLVRTRVGSKMLGEFGRLANFVPLFRTIYFSLKHFADSLVENRSKYKEAVLVEYPEEGTYRLGFLTASTPEKISQAVDEDLQNVFMPNSPNPTAGMLVMIAEDKIFEVDMSIREAFKTIMTTGINKEEADQLMDKHMD